MSTLYEKTIEVLRQKNLPKTEDSNKPHMENLIGSPMLRELIEHKNIYVTSLNGPVALVQFAKFKDPYYIDLDILLEEAQDYPDPLDVFGFSVIECGASEVPIENVLSIFDSIKAALIDTDVKMILAIRDFKTINDTINLRYSYTFIPN
jgi:hypothetical protein